MITQSITKYKEKTYSQPQQYPVTNWQRPQTQMGKLEYALFLKNLPIKIGDLVVPSLSTPPYYDYQVCKVVGIDEIHRFITFGANNSGPMCLELEEFTGRRRPGRASPSYYRTLNPSEYPDRWKEKQIVDV
jgi:hypothetical protein